MRSGEPLKWYDSFPILGYALQLGRCRHCHQTLPPRFLVVEIMLLVAFVGGWPRYENAPLYIYIINMFYVVLFALIGLIDYRTRSIYPSMIYLGCLVAILVGVFSPTRTDGLLPKDLGGVILGGVICGLTYQLIYWLGQAFFKVRALGFGDVLLAVMIGLMLDFPRGFVTLFIGAVFNGIAAALVLFLGRKKMRSFIPYGTILCLTAALALVFGDGVWKFGPFQIVSDLLFLGIKVIINFFAQLFGLDIRYG